MVRYSCWYQRISIQYDLYHESYFAERLKRLEASEDQQQTYVRSGTGPYDNAQRLYSP